MNNSKRLKSFSKFKTKTNKNDYWVPIIPMKNNEQKRNRNGKMFIYNSKNK